MGGRPNDLERGISNLPEREPYTSPLFKGMEDSAPSSRRSRIIQSLTIDNKEMKIRAREDSNKRLPFLTLVNRYRWTSDEERWIYTRYFLNYLYPGQEDFLSIRIEQHEKEYQEYWVKQNENAQVLREAAKVPVMKRSDYIDNIFTSIDWHQPLHTYILNFERGGKKRWVEVGAEALGWKEKYEHPMQFAGWNLPTTVLTPNDYYVDSYRALQALSTALKDKAATDRSAFAVFYQETPERGSVIVPTLYTRTTAPNLFAALILLHEGKPISAARTKAWQEVGAEVDRNLRTAMVAVPVARLALFAVKPIASIAAGGVALGRAALLEIRFAVSSYGYSKSAVIYLGQSARTFYLQYAVPINTAGLTITDIALTLVGQDTGPISLNDPLTFAIQNEKVGWQLYKAEAVEDAVKIDKATQVASLKVTSIEPLTADDAAKHFDSGKLIHHAPSNKAPIQANPKDLPDDSKVAAKSIDNTLAAKKSRATDSNGVAETAAKDKLKPRVASTLADTPPNIHLQELLSKSDIEKLVAKGINRQGLEKLSQIPIGDLERMGVIESRADLHKELLDVQARIARARAATNVKDIKKLEKEHRAILDRMDAREQFNLYKKIISSVSGKSAGAVKNFINEFHAAPGFTDVILNWAKGGISQRGTNFVMKYSVAKFKGKKIRFEWPVGVSKTRLGDDAGRPARYVDIVVDGGTEIRPGESLRIELKSWTDRYLKRRIQDFEWKEKRIAQLQESVAQGKKEIERLKGAAVKNEKEIARLNESVEKNKKSVQDLEESLARSQQQLVRDTAYFTPHNIRWVFNSDLGVTYKEVIEHFAGLISKDPFLRKHWGETKEGIEATLKKVIEMFSEKAP
jgi:hypothetical protein